MFHRTLIRRFCASNSVALETNPLLKEATASALASSASSSPSPRLRRKVLMKNIDKKLLVNLNIHDAVTNVKEVNI